MKTLKNHRLFYLSLFSLALLGMVDSGYLVMEHYGLLSKSFCPFGLFSDCGKVLGSKYSMVFGIPLALTGLAYYTSLSFSIIHSIINKTNRLGKYLTVLLTAAGLVTSAYLVFIQLFILQAICFLCMSSALISLLLFILAQTIFANERKRLIVFFSTFLYKRIARPLLFQTDSDSIHKTLTRVGEMMGKYSLVRFFNQYHFNFSHPSLSQKVGGIRFPNSVGLAAGFDYQARLTQILPSLGFGSQTVGTVTNMSYEGNPPPRLGRLPGSKALMVNKGFKSPGAKVIAAKLEKLSFEIPLGISIGRTNSPIIKTHKENIDDIVESFKTFEKSKVKHSYYELNISCPNLSGDISFYPPNNLEDLLNKVDRLKIKKSIFVKMPIIKTDKETLAMLKVISQHCPVGVIFGNLQTNRKNKALLKDEVEKFKKGNFSGRPTRKRSNELIRLTYKHYPDKLIIIGCGGVFNGQDAYQKIKLGASLIQFVTGLIFEGPQLAAKINLELADLLQKDGFSHISQAVGIEMKK